MTTSFHIHGFWFHVNWTGNVGKDQHGRRWSNPENPQPVDAAAKAAAAIASTTNDLIKLLKQNK